MKLANTLLFGAALAFAFGTAYAADHEAKAKDKEPGFNALDKDRDGYVSKSEAAADADLAKNFARADKDKDGKISRTEYLAHKGKKDVNSAANKASRAADKVEAKVKNGSSAGSTSTKPADKP